MKVGLILKIAFSVSLIGILILLFLSETIEPRLVTISSLSNKDLNKKVKISGEILEIENKEGFQIISIKDQTGEISIIANTQLQISEIKKNITIVGLVQEYEGNIQISADKILSA